MFICLFWTPQVLPQENDLTLPEAESLVRNALEEGNQAAITRQFRKEGSLYSIGSDAKIVSGFQNLEKEGYVKVVPLPSKETGEGEAEAWGIQFTEKAKPYVTEKKNNGNEVFVTLGRVSNFDVRGIERTTRKEYKAEVSLGYRLTPFGEVLLGRGVRIERKEDAQFEAQDDGWRVKLRIDF